MGQLPEAYLIPHFHFPEKREEAWDRFLEQYSRLILKTIWQQYKRYDDVMEIYTRVLYQLRKEDYALIRKYDPTRYHPPPRFSTYLVAIVLRITRAYAPVTAPYPPHSPRFSLPNPDTTLDLEQLLHRLPQEEQHLLQWFYLESRTAREIARLLQISPRQVYYRIQQTLRKLNREVV